MEVSQNLPSGASDDYPTWAPAAPSDQNAVIFQRTLAGGQPQLSTENLRVPDSATPVFSSPTGFIDTEPVYDPSNANEIAFVRSTSTGPSQIYTYDSSTHALVNLSAANGDAANSDSKPDFAPSPNGSGVELIAFQSDRPTAAQSTSNGPCSGTQLYTVSDQAPASGTTSVPVFQTWTGSPSSPTGIQVCATSKNVSGRTVLVADENPVFSPDGTEVAFDQVGFNGVSDTQDIFTAYAPFSDNADRFGQEVDLTPNFATDLAPNWAPVQPGASTPETPMALLLPLGGAGVIGAAVLVAARRRRALAWPAP